MHKFHTHDWEWYQLSDKKDLEKIPSEKTNFNKQSFQKIMRNETNYVRIQVTDEENETLSGSLVYHREVNERENYHIFHFYVSNDFLITAHDKECSMQIDFPSLTQEIKRAHTPIEGFMIFLGEIMTDILYHIDSYESRLDKLIWDVKDRNSIKILEKVYQLRHEILIWKNVMMPFLELRYAVEEAFGEIAIRGKEYKRVETRIERGLTLVDEYQKELNNLVNFEEIVSQHRGNEIMKTLTLFTTFCTPVMAWGALWGMNFSFMPELKWKLGYLSALAIILITTIGVFFYLKSRGWMGDLLKAKKKNSFFR